MKTIAFIGTGVMGRSMAGHLLAAGYNLVVNNRTKEKSRDLLNKGAHWADSPSECAIGADIILTMVGYPADVESLYLGPNGLINSASPNSLLIDMTTSSPSLAKRIAQAASERSLQVLDAPVSGGDLGARNASLSIMVGGSQEAFDNGLPTLNIMGKNVVLQGPSGSGQYCKMANQVAIASNMMGVTEALSYGIVAGLNPRTMLKSIESGAAGSWSLSNLGPRMMDGNFAPGFYVKHFIKDMGIALASAGELGLSLPGLKNAEHLYRVLAAMTQYEIEMALAKAHTLMGQTSHHIQNEIPNQGMVPTIGNVASGADLGTHALFLLYATGRS